MQLLNISTKNTTIVFDFTLIYTQ